MEDQARNKNRIYFSQQLGDEPPVTVAILTINPDITPPELNLNTIYIRAEPTNPEAPNGETIVTLNFQARDDISGLGKVSYRLRDPQGLEHHYFQYHENFYSQFFDDDASSWSAYRDSVVLPVGSAPGTWGLSELYLQDKANNFKVYNFTETIQFVLGNSGDIMVVRIVGYVGEPFGFNFNTEEGKRYTIEATGDLMKCNDVATITGTGSEVKFTDTREAMFEKQYYQVRGE